MKGKIKKDFEGLKKDQFIEVERIRDNWVSGKKQYRYILNKRQSIELSEDYIYVF